MGLSRRNFFLLAGAGTASIVLASPLRGLFARVNKGKAISGKGFGELVADPKGLLDLPKGFQYRAFSMTGQAMSDGNPVPSGHDGMAAFPGENGTTILVRNHELSPNQTAAPAIAPEDKKYDPLAKGGTTTLIIDPDRKLKEHFVSLAGTCRNCSGGPTPWDSWITCEEDTSTPGTNNKVKPGLQVAKKHGYNFEVPSRGRLADPVPLIAMGRFRREAIAVDPQTGYVYQTEDREDSCIYRFLPKEKGNLKAGGVLEALVIKGMAQIDTGIKFPLREAKEVDWVRIEDVDPERDTLRKEAQSKGAAIFRRGEGAVWANGEFYWTCTSGGQAELGQVFRYNPVANTMELFVESTDQGVLDHPDNITIAPFGDLILCEDGYGEQFLVGVNPDGEFYPFARNALNTSEFGGVCFSRDGQTMFVNIQTPGITLAIWGTWG